VNRGTSRCNREGNRGRAGRTGENRRSAVIQAGKLMAQCRRGRQPRLALLRRGREGRGARPRHLDDALACTPPRCGCSSLGAGSGGGGGGRGCPRPGRPGQAPGRATTPHGQDEGRRCCSSPESPVFFFFFFFFSGPGPDDLAVARHGLDAVRSAAIDGIENRRNGTRGQPDGDRHSSAGLAKTSGRPGPGWSPGKNHDRFERHAHESSALRRPDTLDQGVPADVTHKADRPGRPCPPCHGRTVHWSHCSRRSGPSYLLAGGGFFDLRGAAEPVKAKHKARGPLIAVRGPWPFAFVREGNVLRPGDFLGRYARESAAGPTKRDSFDMWESSRKSNRSKVALFEDAPPWWGPGTRGSWRLGLRAS